MKLQHRSYELELLDQPSIPFDALKQNMRELNFINTWLGGHAVSIKGLEQLVENRKRTVVCEIGCGGGDNIHALKAWCNNKGIDAGFIGIDIKKECIEYAKSKADVTAIQWITSDYSTVTFANKPDIIFSSLFCHHFTNEQLKHQLKWMKENSNIGFFVNDLQRHPLAYWSIKILTSLFSSSYLVKNDAPLSVARGFKKEEWHQMFSAAGFAQYKIEWKWAFRYLIIYKHER